jgi:hypothetical protein
LGRIGYSITHHYPLYLITSLNPFLLTIFGGTLLNGRPVSSILKIRYALSRITKLRTDFCTDQNNRQLLYDSVPGLLFSINLPDFSVQCLDFSGNVKTNPCPHTFCLYTKDNLYLSHQQKRMPLNGSAQKCI